MARNIRIDDGVGAMPEPPPLVLGPDGKFDQAAILRVNNLLVQLFRRFNGFISFGGANQGAKAGNLDGQWIVIAATPSVADTEFALPHGLDHTPVFVFSLLDRAGTIYSSQYSSWSPTQIFLKCTAASSAAVILVV